jgi:glyoxylase-like metal-dependent hydrolase (beta-lactamase superfamily II)
MPEVQVINLAMPFRLGSVNCYLVKTASGHVLIDTGSSKKRAELERNLSAQVENLQLIILTHGDFDHTGNAAYLRTRFGAKIAMHHDDAGMLERGDMFWNRKRPNVLVRLMLPLLSGLLGFGKAERATPDFYLEEGQDLSAYGFEAQVLWIPGHSRGSIGILTTGGDLFCGDLLENMEKPAPGSIVDDPAAASASLEKLSGLAINTVYPGHGQPFSMEMLG